VWLSREILKGESDSEIIAAKDQAAQTKYLSRKISQREAANAVLVNNITRLYTTLYQHVQYW
jgi:hypothetical protein